MWNVPPAALAAARSSMSVLPRRRDVHGVIQPLTGSYPSEIVAAPRISCGLDVDVVGRSVAAAGIPGRRVEVGHALAAVVEVFSLYDARERRRCSVERRRHGRAAAAGRREGPPRRVRHERWIDVSGERARDDAPVVNRVRRQSRRHRPRVGQRRFLREHGVHACPECHVGAGRAQIHIVGDRPGGAIPLELWRLRDAGRPNRRRGERRSGWLLRVEIPIVHRVAPHPIRTRPAAFDRARSSLLTG